MKERAPSIMSTAELWQLRAALSDFYSEAEIDIWLQSQHPLLESRKAVDCAAEEVWRVIDLLKSGAYC